MTKLKPYIILIILDGWGISPPWGGNAIAISETPYMDNFWAKFPHTELEASGTAVGLPENEMGNSEVGHMNIGAGRVIKQDISMISEAIKDGSFFEKPALKEIAKKVKANRSSLHLAGLVSDGGIHSHIDHLFALLDFAKKEKIQSVFIHVFTDGRDTPPANALSYVSKLKDKINHCRVGKIASISGRYYAMDRDKRWDRTEKVYQAMVNGIGPEFEDPLKAISNSYANNLNDEFIIPSVIVENSQPVGLVKNNDGLIFFNFRPDRMRQLLQAFCDPRFKGFERIQLKNLLVASMVPYIYDLNYPVAVIFPIPKELKNTLAEVISNNGLSQLHIAETEKYAHVTYFFNGGREKPFPNEDRILVPSPKVATYDLKPEMSAEEITKKVIANLGKYDFIVVNFANPDMVGHTGNLEAAKKAVAVVDKNVGKIVDSIKDQEGIAIITADHGNIEQMIDPITSEPDTEHSTNRVPFILIDFQKKFLNLHPGKLANIAPTILDIMKIKKPAEMTEKSLFSVN